MDLKIIEDSGWQPGRGGRCYYVSHRTVKFADATATEMRAFAEDAKAAWYGQEFSFDVNFNGGILTMRRAVDSGD